MKTRIALILSASLALSGVAVHAQLPSAPAAKLPNAAPPATTNSLAAPVDAAALRRQLTTFQGILTRELQQSFEQPFGLLQDVKGVYLSRYGVAFHMEVNLVPLRVLSMFDYRPYTEEELRKTRDAKLARIQQLKIRLSEILITNAQELGAVPADQQVAVVVHLFNMPAERVEGLPAQVVLEVSHRALTDTKAGRLSKDEFLKQISFLQL